MGFLFKKLQEVFKAKEEDESSGDETIDPDAKGLSHVGKAAYEVLRKKHNNAHHRTWDVTSGKVVALDDTPKGYFDTKSDPPAGHSDWLPQKLGEIMSKAEHWVDVMSLGPPDGQFMVHMKAAIEKINARAKQDQPVVIRMLFGNIIGMPCNCTKIVQELTAGLPSNPAILLWVGAWRNGVSWNHAKMVAVDGKYLHTGGHNLWDKHYLRHSPVYDLSIELQFKIAHSGHLFANEHWAYIESVQSSIGGRFASMLPDGMPVVLAARVTVTDFPDDEAGEFPPRYRKRFMPAYRPPPGSLNMIAIGRQGQIGDFDKAADSAFVAMIESAERIVRLGLQDLGPVVVPNTKIALPGCTWPHRYLDAMARVIWTKGVDVEILLSNPNSIPGGLSGTEANYGNGWSCVDVAAEIIKSIIKLYPEANDQDAKLRKIVHDNLRICFLRSAHGNAWSDGNTKGMHAKHFIVDDVCTYIGSQNLYVCDLAEWGVVIDDEEQTKKIKEEYWDAMWKHSFKGKDVDVQSVMDGLEIDRDGEDPANVSAAQLMEAAKATTQFPSSKYVLDGED